MIGDATVAYNGIYRKGRRVRRWIVVEGIADLPYSFIRLLRRGCGHRINAIAATSRHPAPGAPMVRY